MAVAHLAGPCITAQGRFRRQRCSWCGTALIEDDLTLMAFAPGCSTEPMQWEPGSWVQVSDGNPCAMVTLFHPDATMPDNSCMAVEVDAARIGEVER